MKAIVEKVDTEKITCRVDGDIVMYIPLNEVGFIVNLGDNLEIILDDDLYVTFKKERLPSTLKNNEIIYINKIQSGGVMDVHSN